MAVVMGVTRVSSHGKKLDEICEYPERRTPCEKNSRVQLSHHKRG